MIAILLLAMAAEPDLSRSGWLQSLALYRESRAPQDEYSIESHIEAGSLFRESINENMDKRTIHWAGVRLVWETIQMTIMYVTSDHERKGKQ